MYENQEYQRQMAVSLVVTMGVNAAVEFARINHWEGVLDQIDRVAGLLVLEGDDTIH
jgi:hypothetical protein